MSLGDFHLSLSILIPPPLSLVRLRMGRGAGRISMVVQSLREQSVF